VAAVWFVPGKYKDKRLVQGQAPVADAGLLELALGMQDAGTKGWSEAGTAVGNKADSRGGYTVPGQDLLQEQRERPTGPVLKRVQMEGQCSRTEHSRRHTAVRTAGLGSRLVVAADTAGSMQSSQGQRS